MSRSHRRHSGASVEARSAKSCEPGIQKQAQRARLDSGRAPAGAPPNDDADDRDPTGAFRTAIRALGGHRYCTKSRCRRHRACTGDAPACFSRFFQAWPEETKNWFRAFLTAFREVNDKQQAVKIAYEKMAQHAQVVARLDAAQHGIPSLQGEDRPPKAGGVGSGGAPPPAARGDRGTTGVMDSGSGAKATSRNDVSEKWAESRDSSPLNPVTKADLSPSDGQNHLNAPKIRSL